MHIGVDVDGVLRRFMGSVHREWLKRHPEDEDKLVDPYDVEYWDIRKIADTHKLGERIEEFALNVPNSSFDCFRNADCFDGEIQAMERFYHDATFEDHVVSICTSQDNPWQKEATVEWLHEYDVPFDNVILTGSGKGHFGLDALFDDRVKNCRAVEQNGGLGVLKKMEYNNRDKVRASANSVDQYRKIILNVL